MFSERKKIDQIFYLFIIAIVIHSVFVIIESLTTGKRAFGILGVFYVDLAGLGVLYSIIYFLYNYGSKRYMFGLSSAIILIGLILSQTRNAWLSTAVALFFLFIFLFIKAEKYKMDRKVIITIITGFILI